MALVNGIVYDKTTRAPVENATIIIGTDFALSHENGEFAMEVPVGIYDIVVIQRFYRKLKQHLEVLGNISLNIEMERE